MSSSYDELHDEVLAPSGAVTPAAVRNDRLASDRAAIPPRGGEPAIVFIALAWRRRRRGLRCSGRTLARMWARMLQAGMHGVPKQAQAGEGGLSSFRFV